MDIRASVTLLLIAISLWAGGCKGNCRKLSERLCDCSLNSLDKEICLQRASTEDARIQPTDRDNAKCGEFLKTCDCNRIQTTQGKIDCGLANRPPQPDGGGGG